jgi:hypothetical protein
VAVRGMWEERVDPKPPMMERDGPPVGHFFFVVQTQPIERVFRWQALDVPLDSLDWDEAHAHRNHVTSLANSCPVAAMSLTPSAPSPPERPLITVRRVLSHQFGSLEATTLVFALPYSRESFFLPPGGDSGHQGVYICV